MSYKKYTGLGLAGLLYFANPSEAQENRITELQTRINATRIMLADSTTDGLGESQAGADLMRMIAERDSLVVDNSASEEAQTDSTPAIERPKRYPSIIIGTHAGQSRGLEAGVQYGQFALTANYNTAGNETTHEETGPTSLTGMQGQIRTYEGNYNAIGAGIEYHPESSNISLGLGINHWNYDKTREITIRKNDGSVKRDSDYEPKSNISGRVSAGFSKELSPQNRAELTANYDTRKGFSAGLRFKRRLGRK